MGFTLGLFRGQKVAATKSPADKHDSVTKRGSGGSVKVDAGIANSQTADAAEFQQSRFIGIRSYLHQFYASPTNEEMEPEGGWYLLPAPAPSRLSMCISRVAFILGFLLLLTGAIMLVVAYAYPKPTLDQRLLEMEADVDDYGRAWLTRENIDSLLHDRFHVVKLAGVCLLGIGGALLAISMIPPACGQWFDPTHQPVRAWSDIMDIPSPGEQRATKAVPTSMTPAFSAQFVEKAVQPASTDFVGRE